MRWVRTYYIFIIQAVIFLAVAWKFQPEDSGGVGKIILLVLGILAGVGILIGVIYLFAKYGKKISMPGLEDTRKFFGWLAGRDPIGTTLLIGLFLLTLSYAVGGREEWKDSLRWWWNSKIFLPSLLAVIGVIVFADAKWRKKINNALIFTTSAMMLFSLIVATPAITGLFGGKDKDKKREGSASRETPQNVAVKLEEKTRKETILAEYGAFKEVKLPPTEKLIHVGWEAPPEYSSRCLVAIEQEGNPETQVFPCGQDKSFLKVVKIGFSSDDPLEGVPVTVKIIYLEAE